ncbi:hypothetical protein EJB05_26815 [Eragrostis curvula]|uniref:ABC transporter domain-containing protein n=1 Tax=Eragrostis curvula TaxID=38414 RepID=A0A5J9UKW5_9POAL|nr:hypothetical protein EJB05_26815 [Eragrostis curvula]
MLFNNANLLVERGEKIAIIGPNGCGKSTLLKLILGMEKPQGGEVILGDHNVLPNYFEQNQAEALDLEKTVLDTVADAAEDWKLDQIKGLLGRCNFRDDMLDRKVQFLSGGEKARLAFCKFMVTPSTLLILDEPTNHLDIPSKEMLEEAISEYTGTVITVSHDRYFIKQIVNRVIEVKDQTIQDYQGDYNYYLERNLEARERELAREEELEEKAPKVKAKSKMSKAEKIARKKQKMQAFQQSKQKSKGLKNSKRSEDSVGVAIQFDIGQFKTPANVPCQVVNNAIAASFEAASDKITMDILEIHQVPTIVPFFPDEEDTAVDDGGLYGPSSPALPLGRTPTFTGDGTSATTGSDADGEATATGIGADAAAGLGAMADAAALRAAASADANAELNTAAARTGFCPSNAAACTGFRAKAASSGACAATAGRGGGGAEAEEPAGTDTGALLRREGSLASWQCSARPSNTRYGSSTAAAAPAAARYTNSAYPRDRPVSASKPNGPPSSSPNRAKNARSRSAQASGATLVTYTRLPAPPPPEPDDESGVGPSEANCAETGLPATRTPGAPRSARRAAAREAKVTKPYPLHRPPEARSATVWQPKRAPPKPENASASAALSARGGRPWTKRRRWEGDASAAARRRARSAGSAAAASARMDTRRGFE